MRSVAIPHFTFTGQSGSAIQAIYHPSKTLNPFIVPWDISTWYHVFVACNYVSGGLLTYIHLYHNLKKDTGFTTATFVFIKLFTEYFSGEKG
ncbi:hypothetical protein ACROYT_G017699 [Oculina patagonica]